MISEAWSNQSNYLRVHINLNSKISDLLTIRQAFRIFDVVFYEKGGKIQAEISRIRALRNVHTNKPEMSTRTKEVFRLSHWVK